MSILAMPTMLKCILCGSNVKKNEVNISNTKRIDEYTCVCPECLPRWKQIPDKEKEQLLSITISESALRVIRSFCSDMIGFFYRLFMAIYEQIKQHPVALIYVIIITAYGIFCMLDYLNLLTEGRIGISVGSSRGSIPLFFVPPIGIWLSWSGLNKLINAGRDFDRSLGYMKITGGSVLIVITHFFLIVIR